MIAPPMAPTWPSASHPMISPTASQTKRKPMTTRMLLRLLRAIWWYMSSGDLALVAHHGVADTLGYITTPDLRPYQPVAERRHVLRVVLEVVRPHCAVPLVRDLTLTVARRRAHLVGRARHRDVEGLPAAELQAVAEVQVLAEHEVAGVEKADPVECRPPQHQAGRGAGIHLVDVRLRHMPHFVAAEARAPWKKLAQADGLIDKGARDGERAPRVG